MANDWIIDVLADLKTYAKKNGLSALAGQLEETTLVALAEIASRDGKALETAKWEIDETGRLYRSDAERQNA
jgi:hypothetical protein